MTWLCATCSPWWGSPEPLYPPLPLPDPAGEGGRRGRSLPWPSNLLPLLSAHHSLLIGVRIRIPPGFPDERPSLFPSLPHLHLLLLLTPSPSGPSPCLTSWHVTFFPTLKQKTEHETRPSMYANEIETEAKSNKSWLSSHIWKSGKQWKPFV